MRSAELQLSYTTLRAPIAGRAGLRSVDPGNIVKASDATGLVTIAQQSPITTVFAVPEDRLPAIMQRLRGGQALRVEAWDRDMQTRLAEGRLLAVDSLIDSTTGTVKLKAEYANRDGALFPNQFVNVRLLLDTLAGVVAVPTAAVQQGAKGSHVYRLGADGTVAAVPVKLGPVDGPLAALPRSNSQGRAAVSNASVLAKYRANWATCHCMASQGCRLGLARTLAGSMAATMASHWGCVRSMARSSGVLCGGRMLRGRTAVIAPPHQ